jgi:hypothetical protein
MSWERRGTRSYYYTTVRDACGKVVKTYLGRGERAEAAAEEVARRRAREAQERAAVHGLKRLLRGDDQLGERLDLAAEAMAIVALTSNGFHRPNYGPWRRRRT